MALNNVVKEHRTALAHPLSPAVTRRSFLKGSLGAAVLAAGTSLTACGGSADDQSDGTVLRVGTENPHSSFDTQITSNSWGASENI